VTRLLPALLVPVALVGCGSSARAGAIDAHNAKRLVVSGAAQGALPAAASGVTPLTRVAPNGKWKVVAAARRAVLLLDAATGATLDVLSTVAAPRSIGWTRDSRTFAVGGGDGRISVWEEFKHRTYDLTGARAAATALAFSPDGRLVASAHGDRTLRLWDAARRKQVALVTLPAVALRLRFSADGRRLLAGDTSRVWQLTLPR
jgi:WD40 repeat protein